MKKLLFVALFIFSLCANSDIFSASSKYISKHYNPECPFYLKKDKLSKKGDYAVLSALAVCKNSDKNGEVCLVDDVYFVFCLKKQDNNWNVVYDFTRTDVPSIEEFRYIKKTFPKDFPKEILPKFWRHKLQVEMISIDNKKDIRFDNKTVFLNGKRLKDGTYEVYFDYSLYLEFSIKNGLLSGQCREFYDDGTLYNAGFYKDGEPVGVSKNFYENGKIWFKQYYENGKLKKAITYDKDGNIIVKD